MHRQPGSFGRDEGKDQSEGFRLTKAVVGNACQVLGSSPHDRWTLDPSALKGKDIAPLNEPYKDVGLESKGLDRGRHLAPYRHPDHLLIALHHKHVTFLIESLQGR